MFGIPDILTNTFFWLHYNFRSQSRNRKCLGIRSQLKILKKGITKKGWKIGVLHGGYCLINYEFVNSKLFSFNLIPISYITVLKFFQFLKKMSDSLKKKGMVYLFRIWDIYGL